MAKTIKSILLDESPKNTKKINKALGGENASPDALATFEELKREIANDTFVDFPKLKLVITNSYILSYNLTFAYKFDVVPLSTVKNAYRTNIYNGEYDYDCFYLAVELISGDVREFAAICRNKKALDAYVEVISEIQKRANCWSRGD